jgi:hypothetical protein
MVNAGVVFLYHLGKGIGEDDMYLLTLLDYLKNRELILRKLTKSTSLARDELKKVLIIVMNGGNHPLAKSNKWIRSFKECCHILRSNITENNNIEYDAYGTYAEDQNRQARQDKKSLPIKNIEASFVSQKIYELENYVINQFVDYMKNKGFISNKDYILCFDGVCVPKSNNDIQLLEEAISKFRAFDMDENEIGYFELKIKPFDSLEAKYLHKPPTHRDMYLSDDYYWNEFCDDMLDSSPEDRLGILLQKLSKVSFMLNEMPDHIIVKISVENMYHKLKLNSIKFTINYVSGNDAKGRPIFKNQSLGNMILEYSQYIKRYDEVVFRPLGNSGRKQFNAFDGVRAKRVEKVDTELIKPILYHILECWASGNNEHYEYILNWFRVLFTEYKVKRAIVLYSAEQQIGKGAIINEFLIPFVFGNQYAMSIAGLSSATDKFNSLMQNKLLINCDETSCLKDVSNKSVFDILKKRITDKTIEITRKCIDTVIKEDYTNYIITTNNLFSVKIEQGDDRYFVLNVSPKFRRNKVYFDKLLESFTQESADHFYTWILERPEASISEIPMTAIKMNIMKASLYNSVKFLIDVKSGEYKINDCDINDGFIQASILYNHFKKWTEQGGERLTTRGTFYSQIYEVMEKKRKNSGMFYNLNTSKLDKYIINE